MRILAAIDSSDAIEKILTCLDLPTREPLLPHSGRKWILCLFNAPRLLFCSAMKYRMPLCRKAISNAPIFG
jgi:hypothetical protein